MRFTVVTAFPDFVEAFLSTSVIGRAASSGALSVDVVDLRDYADGDYGQIDHYVFGGGGMLLMAEPLGRAVEAARATSNPYVVYPSPQGAVLHQEMVETLAGKEHLVLICGRYEGVDERFTEAFVDLEVSLGDFVLTGGELPAMVLIDAVARLLPGVVGREEAVERTRRRRPDVVARASMIPYMSHGAYVLILADGEKERELPLLSRACESYGVTRLLWASHPGESRRSAAGSAKTFPSPEKALRWIGAREKKAPFVVGLSRERVEGALHWSQLKRELLEKDLPLAFVLGPTEGETLEIERCDAVLQPIRGGSGDPGSLSSAGLLSVLLDRFFGWR